MNHSSDTGIDYAIFNEVLGLDDDETSSFSRGVIRLFFEQTDKILQSILEDL